MISQGQEVSKVSEDKEQPCPAKTEVIPEIGAHQNKLGTLIMVGYGETNPKHLHQELGLSGGHSLSHSADVSALNQGRELGEHHRGDNCKVDGWKERAQILTVLFLVCNLLTKHVVWAAHSCLPNSNLILVTFEQKTRKEILV